MSDRQECESQDNCLDSIGSNNSLFVVGIGASAGGLNALEELFDHLSVDTGAVFVVIQHLSPDFKSLMKELLQQHTDMAVYRVTEGMELQPNSVYLIPPGKNLTVEANILRLKERKKDKNHKHELNFPIDLFFTSLAKNYREQAIGIILSGSGSDGTRGLRAIHEAGGIALVQNPETAQFDGMPRSAIATGVVNRILAPLELAQLIYQYIVSPLDLLDTESTENSLITNYSLKRIADILVETENIDFSNYKTSTMSRRIHRRRLLNNFKDTSSYIDFLDSSAEERKILCSDLLINVTQFFRNLPAWESIENNILPVLIEQTKPHTELRFWVAGCSTGEEAYSLAILVHEALEDTDKPLSVKIFATDIDRIALEKASQGIYPQSIANEIAPERLYKYFIPQDNCYHVMRKIREILIFSVHDLSKDVGFTRMNLIICRNVLIYMQPTLQQQVLRNFHFSLVVKGILFLGEAESAGIFETEFNSLNKKWKIYQKRRDIRLPYSIKTVPRIAAHSLLRSFKPQISSKAHPVQEQSLLRLLQESNSVILLVSQDNRLLNVYGDSSTIFKPLHGEIVSEVTKMVVFPLKLPLSTALHRAKKEKQSVVYTGIKLEKSKDCYEVSLKVIPPQPNKKDGDFYLVQINQQATLPSPEIPEAEQFQLNNEAQRRIVELEQELRHTRENLQALIEELETTNEEQQASNEELTASNEELQSTNEELHSVNEELHTVNIEYQIKIHELTQLNNDIDNLLKSTEIGVIFLDPELRIRKFTPAATEAVSLRYTDIERPLKELTIKIECPQLPELLEQVLEQQHYIELEVKLKEDDSYLLMRIHPYQTEDQQNDGIVVTFVKIDEIKTVQLELEHTLLEKNRQLAAIETASDGIAILNEDKFIYVNQAHLEMFGYSKPEELIGQSWHILYEPEDLAQFEQEVFPFLLEQGKWQGETKAKHRDGYTFDEEVTLTFTPKGDLICICRDITAIKQAQQQLVRANAELEQRVAQRTQTLADFSDRLKQLHRLARSEYQQLDALFADYLQTGCQMLTLSTGILSEVNNSLSKIVALESPLDLAVGYEVPCQDTYCSAMVNSLKTITYIGVETIEEIEKDPVYLNLKLESLISTPIFVNGHLYGILTFADTTAREKEFSQEEIEIVELMARDIGQFIASLQTKIILQNSESLFRNTFEQAAVGIAHISVEGRFMRVNQRLCQIVGYERDSLIELTFPEITHPDDLKVDLEYVRQMLAEEISTYSMEKRYIHCNGSIVWINLTGSLVKNHLGEPNYFISVVEDISDRKQTEIALEESRIDLKQANQAKDNFIAHMSHELRTPLNSVLGFSRILQKDPHSSQQQLHSLDIIYQSGQHLLRLINDILDLSKITATKLELELQKFHFRQFLQEISTIFSLRAQQKGLEFSVQILPSIPEVVSADQTRLRQVLFNLLSNAVKFTENGSITFTVGKLADFEGATPQYCQIEGNGFHIATSSETESAAISHLLRFQVEDTGIGVPAHKFADIFTPFGQLNGTRGNEEGTGLGLTISHNIVQLMGGQIQLESQVSQGSKFWFDLELREVEGILLPASSELSSQPPRRLNIPSKILVVDDNDNNRALLSNYLQPLGFMLAEANNGEDGLATAKTFQPDAILVDLVMPLMDGKEMIRQIKQQQDLQDPVIIMISANSQLILKSSDLDCHGFLAKPVNFQQLLDLLESNLQLEWQSHETITEPENLSTPIVPPPQEELNQLLKLVDIGDMEAVEEKINSLATLDSQYSIFVQEVRQLAANFQQYKLEVFIKNFVD